MESVGRETASTGEDSAAYQPPADHAEQLSPLLQSGERVLWSGRPDPRAFRRTCYGPGSRWLVPLFHLVWASLCGALLSYIPSGDGLFLRIAFVLICYAVVFLMLPPALGWYASAGIRRVLYAVTDRRVIVDMPKGMRSYLLVTENLSKQFGRGEIEFLHVRETRTGFGNLALAPGLGPSISAGMKIPIKGLVAISSPHEVAALIRKQEYAPHVSAKAPLLTRFLSRC